MYCFYACVDDICCYRLLASVAGNIFVALKILCQSRSMITSADLNVSTRLNRGFHKHLNLAILASESLLFENKKSATKCHPVSIGPLPFRSNNLLSELAKHVLFERSLKGLLFLHNLNLGLGSFS